MNETTECSLFDVGCWTDWLLTGVVNGLLWLLESVLNALAAILEAIPAPDWMVNIGSMNLPDSVLFWTTLFQMPAGFVIVGSALTIRFLIRRIPVIG